MAAGDTTQGRRVDDYFAFFEAEPPVAWKVSVDGVVCWHARHPGECSGAPSGLLLGPDPPASGHVVQENEDGTITVQPNPPADPSNSNSILCPLCGWHGYIDGDVWREV